MLEAIRQWLPWLGVLYLLEGVVWVRRNRPLLCLDVTGEGRWLAPGLRWSGVLPARALLAPRAAAGPAPAAQAFDLGALEQRLDVWHQASRPLARLVLVELGWIFGGLNVVYLLTAPPPVPTVALAVALVLHLAAAAAATRLARLLRRQRIALPPGAVTAVWIYPPATLRAVGGLGREVLAEFHPLALSARFLGLDELSSQARRELASAPQGSDERASVLELLRRKGLSEQAVLAPPSRRDGSARAYCPVCTGEFLAVSTTCPDCEVAVVPFPRQALQQST